MDPIPTASLINIVDAVIVSATLTEPRTSRFVVGVSLPIPTLFS